jgi:hypothetical protein
MWTLEGMPTGASCDEKTHESFNGTCKTPPISAECVKKQEYGMIPAVKRAIQRYKTPNTHCNM